MKKLLKNIVKFLSKKGPAIALVLAIAVIASSFMNVDLALAEGAVGENQEKAEQSLGFLVSLFIQGLNLFLWPFLIIIGDLMDNDLIIGPGMEDRLLSIWVQVRNLVNIGFAVFLLIIAFYNVLPLGEGEGNLAIKTALPKLVLGLILVNFTFLGGKILLDVSNIGTTAAFALPELVEEFSFDTEREEFRQSVCVKENPGNMPEDPDEMGPALEVPWDAANDSDEVPIYTALFCAYDEDSQTYIGADGTPALNETMSTTYFQDLNANNVGLVMAINMGALDSLALLKDGAIQDFGDLVINSLFSLVMYFIMCCTYIVLGLVLLARIVVLWVALALSPVIVLFYVIPQLKEAVGSNLDIMEKVTKHLLAPVIIGLTLTIGYMMLAAIGDFASISTATADQVMSTEFLMSGIQDMEKFIIAIASVVIIWTGIFAAAEGTVAQFATNAVKGFGEKIGGALAKAPLYATTIPVGIGKDQPAANVSPMAIFGLADATMNNMQSQANLSSQLQDMAKNSPAIEYLVGDLNVPENMSKQENIDNAMALASHKEITSGDAQRIANSLAQVARASENKELERELKAAGSDIGQIRTILNNTTAEEIGMEATDFNTMVRNLKDTSIKEAAAAPAEPAAPSGGAQVGTGVAPDDDKKEPTPEEIAAAAAAAAGAGEEPAQDEPK
jgi:hypothetical protein